MIRTFFKVLFHPLVVFYIGVGLYFVFLKIRRIKTANIILIFAAGLLVVSSFTFVPGIMIKSLEQRYETLSDSTIKEISIPVRIIVLGNGFSDDLTLASNDRLSENALGRLVEGLRIYRILKNNECTIRPGDKEEDRRADVTDARLTPHTAVRLIVSGYAGMLSVSQAEVMRSTAISLGVDPKDIDMMSSTRNTADEARTFSAIFPKIGSTVLVTDAVHMPRATKLFFKQGITVYPAPTNHIMKISSKHSPSSWLPSAENLSKMDIVIHEYVGLLWTWLGGE